MKSLLFSSLLLFFTGVLYAQVELSHAELERLNELTDMAAPSGFEQEKAEYLQENCAWKEEFRQRRTDYDYLVRTQLMVEENNIAFLKGKIETLEAKREAIYQEVEEQFDAMMRFNGEMQDFFNNQIQERSLLLGAPVFQRDKIFYGDQEGGKTLIIDLSHHPDKKVKAVGWEILCAGMGSAQFVVANQEENGNLSLQKVGEIINITEADAVEGKQSTLQDKQIVYRQKVAFSGNFQDLHEGDYFGIIVDNSLQLTYDELDTGESLVVPVLYNEYEEITEPIDIPHEWLDAQAGISDSDEILGRNHGKAFSFCLFCRGIEEQEEE